MPMSLTIVEFKDAVSKGLGRAVLSITPPVSPEVAELILTSFHRRAFNQYNNSRGEYRYFLAEKAGLLDELLVRLTDLPEDESGEVLHERVELLGSFVRRKNPVALAAVRSLALNGSMDGITELVTSGDLKWVVDNILPTLPIDEKWRANVWLEDNPGVDEERKQLLLTAYEDYSSNHVIDSPPDPPVKDFEQLFCEILYGAPTRSELRKLRRELTQEQFDRIFEVWLSPESGQQGETAAYILQNSKLQMDVGRVIEKVKSGSAPFDFEGILGEIDMPEISDLGIELLQEDPPDPRGFDCLRSSYYVEDLDTIAEVLPKFDDFDNVERHWICLSLIGIAEFDEGKRNLPIMRWVYEKSPCSFCRLSAVQMMVEAKNLPEEYFEEMRFDSDSEIREVARTYPAQREE